MHICNYLLSIMKSSSSTFKMPLRSPTNRSMFFTWASWSRSISSPWIIVHLSVKSMRSFQSPRKNDVRTPARTDGYQIDQSKHHLLRSFCFRLQLLELVERDVPVCNWRLRKLSLQNRILCRLLCYSRRAHRFGQFPSHSETLAILRWHSFGLFPTDRSLWQTKTGITEG